MKFKTLYARTSTGAIQEWTINVEGNSYTTTYGQKDGQLVTTAPSYCEGKNVGKKNETSPEQQAIKEAVAIFKKKQKEGYFEDINDVDKEVFFQPQLAKKFIDYQDKVVYPLIVEDKLNGIRCAFSAKGAFSRTGEEFHCLDHIKQELTSYFEEYPNLILDGELFNPALKNELNVIASLVSVNRKESDVTDEDRQKAKDLIQFHIYDGFNSGSEAIISKDSPLHSRKAWLKLLLYNNTNPSIVIHPHEYVDSYETIMDMMTKVKEENREGLMIKDPYAPYENKRSKGFLKLKVFMDEEFEVLGFLEGTGNWAGKVKKVVCKLKVPASNGKTDFESNIRGTMEQLEELWRTREQHIGKRVTVTFQEWSPYGVPLIPYCDPLFRDYE